MQCDCRERKLDISRLIYHRHSALSSRERLRHPFVVYGTVVVSLIGLSEFLLCSSSRSVEQRE